MTQYSNQFIQSQEKGTLTLVLNNNVIPAIVDANETATLVAGDAVKLKDVSSKIPKIEKATALTDNIFGFIPYNVITNQYVANEALNVAFNDCVMVMQASAAIAVGVEVQYDPSTAKIATKVAPNTTIGVILDKATSDGDLVRVLIKTPGNSDYDLSGITASVSELNILDGATITTAELNYLDLTTGAGTQEALKAVVADANVNTGVSKITELHIGASGSETQVTASAAEINKLDTSAETETITSGAISVLKRITYLDTTAGATLYTLAAPNASMLGLVKVISFAVDNGDATLTLTNVQGGSAATTCTWSAVGQELVLVAGATKWNVVSEGGVVLS